MKTMLWKVQGKKVVAGLILILQVLNAGADQSLNSGAAVEKQDLRSLKEAMISRATLFNNAMAAIGQAKAELANRNYSEAQDVLEQALNLLDSIQNRDKEIVGISEKIAIDWLISYSKKLHQVDSVWKKMVRVSIDLTDSDKIAQQNELVVKMSQFADRLSQLDMEIKNINNSHEEFWKEML